MVVLGGSNSAHRPVMPTDSATGGSDFVFVVVTASAMRVFDHLTILALIVLITWSVANLVATAQTVVSRYRRGVHTNER